MSDEDERYCAVCGDVEFDEDGKPSHDYEPYDHDFEPEEEGITTDDVKNGLDILSKGFDVYKKYKSLNESKPQYIPPPKQPDKEIHKKLTGIHDSIEEGKKIERRRWLIGLGAGVIIAIIVAILL